MSYKRRYVNGKHYVKVGSHGGQRLTHCALWNAERKKKFLPYLYENSILTPNTILQRTTMILLQHGHHYFSL